MANTAHKPTHRRHNPYHDYRQPCIYHITLVCSERAQVLGRIVGNTLAEARCELTPLGVEVSRCISSIEVYGAKHGRKLQLIAKAVMPDHIHFIIYVQERLQDCALGDIIRGFKQGCNKALRAAIAKQEMTQGSQERQDTQVHPHDMGALSNDKLNRSANTPNLSTPTTHAANGSNGAVITSPSLAQGVSRPSYPALSHNDITPHVIPRGYRQPAITISNERMLTGHALFEEDYDETILRRRGQLKTMIRYVHNNPKHRWQKQRHPQLLIPIRGIMIAGRSYDAIGNVTLLGLARHQVWIRSRWDDTTRRQYQNDCIIKARRYHVLVSPFISPHEARVRDVALQEGHSIITLTDNGFTDYTQCPGGLYDYCVNGQVLVLAPSELPHIDNKNAISRQECMMLNARAEEIANEM